MAPWRVGNSAREDASPVCRRFAAWHAARLMPPALRRSTCAGLAVGARPDARGGLLRKGERAERQQRAFVLGTPPPGARPRMSRRPCGAGRGPSAATQTACCTCNELIAIGDGETDLQRGCRWRHGQAGQSQCVGQSVCEGGRNPRRGRRGCEAAACGGRGRLSPGSSVPGEGGGAVAAAVAEEAGGRSGRGRRSGRWGEGVA